MNEDFHDNPESGRAAIRLAADITCARIASMGVFSGAITLSPAEIESKQVDCGVGP
jgi:hypothetical protein